MSTRMRTMGAGAGAMITTVAGEKAGQRVP